jgi:glycosyltransferase involved in cell wall biosynthesis
MRRYHDRLSIKAAIAVEHVRPGVQLVYVTDAPIPSQAANSVQVVKMCRAFQVSGADVRLITFPLADGSDSYRNIAAFYGLPAEADFAISRLRIPSPRARSLLLGAAGALKVRRGPGGLIYTRAISIAAAAAALGRHVVLEMHLPLSSYPKTANRLRWLVRRPEFRLLVVISDNLRRAYERDLPDSAGRILVAHDGADPVDRGVVPASLSGEFKVGYIGHLYPGKGMELIAELVPRCPWATFHVVGGRSEDVAFWRARLADLPNIVFHGHVPHAEASSYVAAMSVVLAPYMRVVYGAGGIHNLADWMSPLKIFEYMSHGKAILASDLPVLREVLTDGENATLLPPENIARWVAALRQFSEDEQLRHRLGNAAEAEFLRRYSWEQRAKAILHRVQEPGAGADW